ncbi:MAG: DUF4274 domain-containing protein [Hyphomonas sp.]
MDDLDLDEKTRLDTTIAWLKNNGPDDWHRAALDFNWNAPLYLLDWIVRQPDCDIATALTIFWKGEPEFFLEEEGSKERKPNGFSYLNRKICAGIAQRVATGAYTRSQIAFTPDTWTKKAFVDLAAAAKDLSNPNIHVVPDLIRKRRGRNVEADAAFYRRYPEDFHHSVLIDLPGDTPRSLALMEKVARVEETVRRKLPFWLRRR